MDHERGEGHRTVELKSLLIYMDADNDDRFESGREEGWRKPKTE